jgi:hypothetical protein
MSEPLSQPKKDGEVTVYEIEVTEEDFEEPPLSRCSTQASDGTNKEKRRNRGSNLEAASTCSGNPCRLRFSVSPCCFLLVDGRDTVCSGP